ncbi:ribokinase [Luteipulveratus mongoliensis]|uniref:Ribokinase n=1 Tax=Luteipulveratus mongoliensis TaxID=571913 RepID=A0A0K1JHY4_9MICO|nr:ribokinase [Luteipulveratus mongoliensis]AKU16327.1 hypothetical protein VV02_11405 [Luteipulveratus mongoliensis]
MAAHVVVVGSINVDLSLMCDRLPAPGETVLARGLQRSPGGKGGNQAVAAARSGGVQTTMVGAVGDDPAGAEMRANLAASAVDVSTVATRRGEPTGLALISVDERGENTIVVVPGANSSLSVDDSVRSIVADADVVLAQLEVPQEIVVAAARARREGVPLILNAAPAAPLIEDLTLETDLLVVNEHEARVIAGVDDADGALAVLARQFPAVLVTLGDRGSVLRRRAYDDVRVTAPKVTAVDTTAAGDTFCGVLAAALAQAQDIGQAMRTATAASALAVQRTGAQASVPTFEETQQQVIEAFGHG